MGSPPLQKCDSPHPPEAPPQSLYPPGYQPPPNVPREQNGENPTLTSGPDPFSISPPQALPEQHSCVPHGMSGKEEQVVKMWKKGGMGKNLQVKDDLTLVTQLKTSTWSATQLLSHTA